MPGILVVEDDENLNRGITFSLKKSGASTTSTRTASITAASNPMKPSIWATVPSTASRKASKTSLPP